MLEPKPKIPSVPPLENAKSPHLKEGVKPIMVSLVSMKDLEIEEYKKLLPLFQNSYISPDDVHDIDFDAKSEILTSKDYLNGGYNTYVISPVDEKDKYSKGYYDCTGIAVTGIEKGSGKNISFLSHQDPKIFLLPRYDRFSIHLKQRLDEIRVRCEDETIDAVIVGGMYHHRSGGLVFNGYDTRKNYLDSLYFLTTEIQKGLGFSPVVVNGPKLKADRSGDRVYYDNAMRRLYLFRPEVNPDTGTFNQDIADEAVSFWDGKINK